MMSNEITSQNEHKLRQQKKKKDVFTLRLRVYLKFKTQEHLLIWLNAMIILIIKICLTGVQLFPNIHISKDVLAEVCVLNFWPCIFLLKVFIMSFCLKFLVPKTNPAVLWKTITETLMKAKILMNYPSAKLKKGMIKC